MFKSSIKEVGVKIFQTWVGVFLTVAVLVGVDSASAQLKLGYIDSKKILEGYKESQDAQKQIQEIKRRWEEEANSMQQDLRAKVEELDSQALLLSDERKREKQTEIQNLDTRLNLFLQEKFGQEGEIFKKQGELLQPVIDKINATIKKIGTEEKFDYIFDVVQGSILHASSSQPDLTNKVLEELNKSVAAAKPAGATTTKPATPPKPKN
jgi:outer membrane protein